ncbi:MAG TPA: BlaI/MecI/CopY family transcriptional regulator [Bryobacteraceae bacterium]|jgi:predicted transcriptional regulator
MPVPRLSKLELQVMEILWSRGELCVRDILEAMPPKKRPAYTTIQTIVHRLEVKQAIRRSRKIGNIHLFEPVVARHAALHRLIDDFLSLIGGRTHPVMTHLIESGRMTLDDFKEAEKAFKKLAKEKES